MTTNEIKTIEEAISLLEDVIYLSSKELELPRDKAAWRLVKECALRGAIATEAFKNSDVSHVKICEYRDGEIGVDVMGTQSGFCTWHLIARADGDPEQCLKEVRDGLKEYEDDKGEGEDEE